MGSLLSTAQDALGVVVMDVLNEATYRTIVGILLSVPFVMSGMNALADKFRERRKLKGSSSVAKTRSLMIGSMPRRKPTVVVHSTQPKKSSLRVPSLSSIAEEGYETDEKPPVLIQLMDDSPTNSVTMSPRSGLSTSDCDESLEVKLLSPSDTQQAGPVRSLQLPTLPPANITIDVEMNKGTQESQTVTPSSPISGISTVRSRTSSIKSDNNVIGVDTSAYLERCSVTMMDKAEKAEHKEKVAIGKALFDLGKIVYKRERFGRAYKIFKRAAIVQEKAMKETIYSLAWALREKGFAHSRRNEEVLADAYLGLATRLIDSPDHDTLKMAWNTHQELKPLQKVKTKGTDRVERRLKRARNEWIPLALSRKFQHECKTRKQTQDVRAPTHDV